MSVFSRILRQRQGISVGKAHKVGTAECRVDASGQVRCDFGTATNPGDIVVAEGLPEGCCLDMDSRTWICPGFPAHGKLADVRKTYSDETGQAWALVGKTNVAVPVCVGAQRTSPPQEVAPRVQIPPPPPRLPPPWFRTPPAGPGGRVTTPPPPPQEPGPWLRTPPSTPGGGPHVRIPPPPVPPAGFVPTVPGVDQIPVVPGVDRIPTVPKEPPSIRIPPPTYTPPPTTWQPPEIPPTQIPTPTPPPPVTRTPPQLPPPVTRVPPPPIPRVPTPPMPSGPCVVYPPTAMPTSPAPKTQGGCMIPVQLSNPMPEMPPCDCHNSGVSVGECTCNNTDEDQEEVVFNHPPWMTPRQHRRARSMAMWRGMRF